MMLATGVPLVCPMVTKGWMIMQHRRVEEAAVEEWAKIVWINLLESAEVALVTRQSNVPDLPQVNRWRRGLLETLLRLSCEWDMFREKRLQIKSLQGSAGFGYFVVMSCIKVWVGHSHLLCSCLIILWLWYNHSKKPSRTKFSNTHPSPNG
jgi:hypothetical protein